MRADDMAPPLKVFNDQGNFSELPPDFVEILKFELLQELQVSNEFQENTGLLGGNIGFQQQWSLLLKPTITILVKV